MRMPTNTCHPERSEGSRQRREILRYAQDDAALLRALQARDG